MTEQLDLLAADAEDAPVDDPLIGFEFAGIRVTGYAPWNPGYVYVDTPDGPSCRPTSLVRARMLDG